MSERELRVLHRALPGGTAAPSAARSAVAEITRDLRALERADLVVIASELTNMGIDGRSASSPILDLWRTKHGFRVEVRHPRGTHRPGRLARALFDRLAEDWYVHDSVVGAVYEAALPSGETETDETLFARLATGDVRAQETLARRYAYLAGAIARRYRHAGTSREDLEQVASMALVKAMDRFDVGRGFRFTTFAARTIDGELKRYLRDKGWSLRVPRSLQELGLEAVRTADDMTQRRGREPTLREVADALGHGADEVGQALLARRSFHSASLDAPSPGDDEARILDALPADDSRLHMAPAIADVANVVGVLSDRERRILRLRFFDDLSQSEIGSRVGISQMHVSRLLTRSLRRLRETIEG